MVIEIEVWFSNEEVLLVLHGCGDDDGDAFF
jgi:hypothetical protein